MSIVRNVALLGRPSAGDGVDLFDRVAARFERAQNQHHAVDADVIPNEIRLVLGDDHALAESVIRVP
jgi:hypothetical protein